LNAAVSANSRTTIRFGSGPPSISSVAPARARRAFQHVREIVPSADIPHDPSKALSLPTATMDVDRLRIAARRSGCEARVNLDEKVSPDA
jgi:hypothetical protein